MRPERLVDARHSVDVRGTSGGREAAYIGDCKRGPMDKIERLRNRIAELESERAFKGRSYLEGLTGFPGVLPGQGFFPGGDGLWRNIPSLTDTPPFPVGGVVVLGNDFGCEDNPDPKNPGFIQCLDRGFEDPP